MVWKDRLKWTCASPKNLHSFLSPITPVAVHTRIRTDTGTRRLFLLSWNETPTCWTLYQGSNSFGSRPLWYRSSERRQSVCRRRGLHSRQWWSRRNWSIWESGWQTPGALAAGTWRRKISTGIEGGEETNPSLWQNKTLLEYSTNSYDVHRQAYRQAHTHTHMHTRKHSD